MHERVKKLHRIYREEGLTVCKRGGRKRAVGTTTPMAIPQGPNQRRSLDFVTDSLRHARRLHRRMAYRLQRPPPTHKPPWLDTSRIC